MSFTEDYEPTNYVLGERTFKRHGTGTRSAAGSFSSVSYAAGSEGEGLFSTPDSPTSTSSTDYEADVDRFRMIPLDQDLPPTMSSFQSTMFDSLGSKTPLVTTPQVLTEDCSTWIRPSYFSEQARTETHGQEMLESVGSALLSKKSPRPIKDGTTGAYFMMNPDGRFKAIFKPEQVSTSELNLTRRSCFGAFSNHDLTTASVDPHTPYSGRAGIRYDETPVREVAAYLLDHDRFVNVPETIMVQINSRSFKRYGLRRPGLDSDDENPVPTQRSNSLSSVSCNSEAKSVTDHRAPKIYGRQHWRVGSLQAYIHHDADSGEIGCSQFDVEMVHRIGLFDIRVMNTDRHDGNILVQLEEPGNYSSKKTLVPIDHGLILADFDDVAVDGNFCWGGWPQAKKEFSETCKDYIRNLNAERDCKMLIRLLGNKVSLRGLMSLKIGTALLQVSVLEFNLTLLEIANLIRESLLGVISSAKVDADFSDPGENEASFMECFKVNLRNEIKSSRGRPQAMI